MKSQFLLLLFNLCICYVLADKCKSMETCSECMRTPNCNWCGKPGNNIPNTEECISKAIYQCGVCSCLDDYRGRNCECGPDTPWGSGVIDESACRADNFSKICSGQGTCNCGECKCHKRNNMDEIIDGVYCQCTNFLCDHVNGLICSGPDHGSCVCNTCVCKPGWSGDACQCLDSTKNCINPDSGEICSNQGTCDCNHCKCFDSEGGRYYGKYCEECPNCRGKCTLFKSCVQCQAFGTGEFSPEECLEECTLFNVTKVVEVNGGDPELERLCTFYDEDDCRFKFVYSYDENNNPFVRTQMTRECPPRKNILGITLGVIGGLTGVGLLLLVIIRI